MLSFKKNKKGTRLIFQEDGYSTFYRALEQGREIFKVSILDNSRNKDYISRFYFGENDSSKWEEDLQKLLIGFDDLTFCDGFKVIQKRDKIQ